jgi:hypothetical protein
MHVAGSASSVVVGCGDDGCPGVGHVGQRRCAARRLRQSPGTAGTSIPVLDQRSLERMGRLDVLIVNKSDRLTALYGGIIFRLVYLTFNINSGLSPELLSLNCGPTFGLSVRCIRPCFIATPARHSVLQSMRFARELDHLNGEITTGLGFDRRDRGLGLQFDEPESTPSAQALLPSNKPTRALRAGDRVPVVPIGVVALDRVIHNGCLRHVEKAVGT